MGVSNEVSHIWTNRLADQRDRLWHVGHGRLDWVGRRGVAATRSTWRSSWAAISSIPHWPTAKDIANACLANSCASILDKQLLYGNQDSAQEPQVAVSARISTGRRFSGRLHPRDDRKEPRISGAGSRGPAAVPRLGRLMGTATSGGSGPWTTLKREGLIRAVGISINRWEPWNVMQTLRTGHDRRRCRLIYNIFDQSPEDELFPLLRGIQHRRDRARAVRRRHVDRRADERFALAQRRLSQYLLYSGEPYPNYSARRPA